MKLKTQTFYSELGPLVPMVPSVPEVPLGPKHTFGLAPTCAALGLVAVPRWDRWDTVGQGLGLAHLGLGLGRAGDDSGPSAHCLPRAGAVAADWRALAGAAAAWSRALVRLLVPVGV